MWAKNFQMYNLNLEKVEELENIHQTTEKAKEYQKNIYLCFISYTKAFNSVHHNKLENY